MIEKLKKRNQELLDGAGAAMTQDDKEAMEREISALRGQVALLERNNRIFSDQERKDLKQDLDMANKRCMNLQTQLLTLKKRMEYEEIQKLQKECDNFKAEAEKLREQLREYEDQQSRSDSDSDNSNHGEKYARLLELEEEAEDLKAKIKEKEEDLKDRDVMVDELQHQLENVKKQHHEEAKKLEKKNKERETEMMEEVRDLEKQVEDCQEMIELKQYNLKNKCNQLEESEFEIEKLQKEVQKKNKEIEKLKWEIESLQRENASLRERIDNLRQALNDVNSMPTSPITSFRSPNTSMQFRSRSSSRSSTPRTSPQRKSDLTHRSAESFESSTGPVRASSSVDEDSDGKRMRSPLRSGIESAKQKVHDIGDVLDTPRSASTVKSPIHKEPINIWPHVGLHRSTEDIGTDAKPIEPEKEDETSSSSSSSESVSLGNVRPNRLNVSSPMDVQDHTQNAPPSNSPFGQDDSVQDVPGLGDKQKGGKEKSIDKFDENLRLGTGVQEPDVVALKSDSLTELHNTDPMREDLVSVISVPSNNATLEATDPIGPSRSSTIGEGLIPEEAVSPNGLLKTKDEDQKRGTNMSSSSTSSLSSVRQPSSPLDSQRPREARAETVQTDQSSQNFKDSERRGKEKKKRGKESPHDSKQNDTDIFEARDRAVANQHSLLPDDRPTLVQEVTKAREEARKWFQEVTQSDREKRNMSRRLAELESELDRLQDIEDNYATLKKKQKEVDKVTRDLETLRAQTAAANRKAEEARERSALLQAHLLDKEEVEAENAKLKENIEVLKHENKERKPSSPLRELQLPSANTSASELASTPRKSKSVEASPSIVELSPADKDQLRSIKDSFEYVAGNFTSLVLKKHDAELTLAPEKAKVSQLKRKCLERDQLLAKLVLKLRKKKHDVSDDVSESHDDISVASSVGLDQMLAKADSLIRTNVVDSDWSDADSLIATTSKDEKGKSNEFISPPRPSSALIRSLTEKSSKSPPSPPTHRIFVAKRDYAPSARSDDDPTAPVTHSLLPDLPVLAGDTVVAIGNPDKRGDGKLYQLAEVRGKIGFVPLAHLVAAEQVEGMQAFVQEKSKKKKSPCSSPEKIVDLYRKLEQAHLLVADKIDRVSRSSKSTAGSNSFDSSARDINQPPLSSTKPYSSSTAKYQENRGEDRRAATIDDDGCRSATSYSPSFMGEWPRKPKSRSSEKGAEGEEPPSKRHLERSRRSSGRSSRRSISPVLPISRDLDIDVRSSTPLLLPEKQSRRSSSLPPRRDEHSSLKRRSKRDKNASTERTLAPPRVLSSPRSPTFVVIEKTMGQKSMIISWTPPVLDMISRSNGIPVIGYEISIDGERRVQISGAYSNKAILGDLDLTRNFLVEVKTVSSVGTLSRPAEVMYSPNADFSAQSELAGSFNQTGTDVMQSTSTPQQSNKSASENLFGSPIRRATALYDYDPAVDSPYKSHDEEIGLNKGSPVLVLGSPRPDGFCDVQVGKKRGIAPIAFLVSEDDDTDTSSMTSSARQKPRSSRPRTKSKRQL
uniref:Early endosome antigen 1-like n=1 Tax=Phallusia mammillata TaxID=59560 RepID=A0A6F9DS32_9ASCI|nr:early endosome antigen 1-like [Phallusia mammillata]